MCGYKVMSVDNARKRPSKLKVQVTKNICKSTNEIRFGTGPSLKKEINRKTVFLIVFVLMTPLHRQLHIWVVTKGHPSNVWSQSLRWQRRSISARPTMTRVHRALSLLKIPEKHVTYTFTTLECFTCLPAPAASAVWCVVLSKICFNGLKKKSRLAVIQPAPVFLSASDAVSDTVQV